MNHDLKSFFIISGSVIAGSLFFIVLGNVILK